MICKLRHSLRALAMAEVINIQSTKSLDELECVQASMAKSVTDKDLTPSMLSDNEKLKPETKKSLFSEETDHQSGEKTVQTDIDTYKQYIEFFLKDEEVLAIKEVLDKVDDKCRIHFLNITSHEALKVASNVPKEYLTTYSVGPHYLYFSADEIEDKDTRFKLAKPILSEYNSTELLKTFASANNSKMIASSMHFPVVPELKQDIQSFARAMPGANTLGFTLQMLWTIYKRKKEIFEELWQVKGDQCDYKYLIKMTEWMSKNPAELMGIDNEKGSITVGKYADFVIWDPDESRLCNEDIIYGANAGGCIYRNNVLECEVKATYLRGMLAFEGGDFLAKKGKAMISSKSGILLL